MARRLSNRIEAIEYIHADDGQPYRHAFKKGGTITLKDDGSVLIRNRDKKLWGMYDVNGDRQPFLENPPAGRATLHTGGPMAKRKLSAAQLRAGFGGKRRKNPASRKTRKAATKTTTIVRYRNPANKAKKSKRRRRRRNPMGVSVQGLLGRLQRGGKDALCVVGGEVGVALISNQFSYADGSMMDTVVEVGSAMALGMVTEKMLGADPARFVLAGGLARGMRKLLKQAKLPYVSSVLGDWSQGNTAALYPNADRTMGAWSGPDTLAGWSAPTSALQAEQPPLFPWAPGARIASVS